MRQGILWRLQGLDPTVVLWHSSVQLHRRDLWPAVELV